MAALEDKSVLAVLKKLRALPRFSWVALKNWEEETARAQVWVSFGPELGEMYRSFLPPRYENDRHLDRAEAKTRAASRLVTEVSDIPAADWFTKSTLRDVDLHETDYGDPRPRLPYGAFLNFQFPRAGSPTPEPLPRRILEEWKAQQREYEADVAAGRVKPRVRKRDWLTEAHEEFDNDDEDKPLSEEDKKVAAKVDAAVDQLLAKSAHEAAINPADGKPGYAVLDSSDIDWLRWTAREGQEELLARAWECWSAGMNLVGLAAVLNGENKKSIYGATFSKASVRRVVIAAELLAGNTSPFPGPG